MNYKPMLIIIICICFCCGVIQYFYTSRFKLIFRKNNATVPGYEFMNVSGTKLISLNVSILNTTSAPIKFILKDISEIKTIFWENAPHWLPQSMNSVTSFDKCGTKSCAFEKIQQRADAMILYMVGYSRQEPPSRPKGQLWILFNLESPYHIFSSVWSLPAWKQQINWTMTYRLDSTIVVPYGKVFSKPEIESQSLHTILTKKSKLVAWVVSNCYTPAKRKEYVDKLQDHLGTQIDTYGKCGHYHTSSGDISDSVFKLIESKYKFYLGFENSLCKDYVTEKFLERQNLNLVIIVRGEGNYSHFYPKNTYIDTRDFNSMRDLTNYIHYLDKNDTAYMQYIANKSKFTSKDRIYTMEMGLCEVCERLHRPIAVPYFYSDINSWWFSNTCHQPNDIIT